MVLHLFGEMTTQNSVKRMEGGLLDKPDVSVSVGQVALGPWRDIKVVMS